MTQFLSNPKFQALDINGDPLSGGLLYTYDPGTTNNKATYPTIADAIAKTNANANPVVLDSRGEASVVLAGNTKLLLKDSDENIIWTLDNVNSDGIMLDNNGNVILGYSTVASAVNYIEVENAATGGSPALAAKGSDTNVPVRLVPKGTGLIEILGSATTAGGLALFEASDNGTNFISVNAPASLAADVALTLPGDDGTSGQLLQTDGSGNLSWADSDGAAKGWIRGDFSGSISASYNVTSISDSGAGIVTVTWATDFANTNYAVVATLQRDNSGTGAANVISETDSGSATRTVTATTFTAVSGDDGVLTDGDAFMVAAFGDQ